MKKLAIITAVITVTALAATAWQIHRYDQDIRRTLEAENVQLRQAIARTELLVSGRQQTISKLELRLMSLTNHPAGEIKAGNS